MQQFTVRCGCSRSMNPYGRAGRNAFRCGCGARVQVIAVSVTTRICAFDDCRMLATTKEPLRFCADHEEEAATLLAHTAGAAKVRELEEDLTKSVSTWTRKYGDRLQPDPQYGRHAPLVYFARREKLIKIGKTTNLRLRMTALHAEALATEPGGIDRERHLQRRFKHARASARSREWFHPTPDLIAYINELRATSSIPSLGSAAPPIGQCVELNSYLAETVVHQTVRTLTQDGALLGGRIVRSNRRSLVHAAVTGTWSSRRAAVAACIQDKALESGAGGLSPMFTVPSLDRCRRSPCRARWGSLQD
ncbi:GIY-YIG nuclease family protein [Streptomyces violaceorubidus]|uniref:GIY-YIG nuclease family protein n=1 Tax=Streptomyces violaceorubidus TaxID=284042 RepID=UPI0012FED6ED|nr:GIY-YIG nuclease family protein [Streptomyces violaceorubidus]